MAKLILVPTPIGNLEDITLRALRILKEADAIFAEDTRQTSKLLQHFQIQNNLKSFHIQNEHKILASSVEFIKSKNMVAFVSDAGTPGISDPGFLLVRECLKNDIEIECLPGATAFVPALVLSGLPCDSFCFEGFLPHKKGRQTRIKALALEERTIVLYESPHRMLKCLEQLLEFFEPERKISVSRELSKMFEETVRGTIKEVLEHFKQKEPRGEFVVVIEGKK